MLKNLVIWLVIGLVLMTVFNQFNTRHTAQSPMEYSQFLDEVKSGQLAKVTIEPFERGTSASAVAGFFLPDVTSAFEVAMGAIHPEWNATHDTANPS